MKRSVLNLAAAVSLMLCLATVALWPLSWYRATRFWGEDRFTPNRFTILSSHGWLRFSGPCEPLAPGAQLPSLGFSRWELGGVNWYRFYHVGPPFAELRIRYRTLLVLFAALPAAQLGLFCFRLLDREGRRRKRGLCVRCGYDLHATPERCPECGVIAEPPHNPPMQRTATASSGAVE